MKHEVCEHCGRPFATHYERWLLSDTECGMSPAWNEDGEHEDCVNECLYATRARLRSQLAETEQRLAEAKTELAQAWRVIEAANRIFTCPRFDWRSFVGKLLAESYDAERAKMGTSGREGLK